MAREPRYSDDLIALTIEHFKNYHEYETDHFWRRILFMHHIIKNNGIFDENINGDNIAKEERNDIRLFSLCRIKNVALTRNNFSLPKNFDYRAENADSFFGVFAGQERHRFKIAFYDYSVVWVKDRQWAEDQEIAETDDGVVVSFTSTQFDKALEWVLSRGKRH